MRWATALSKLLVGTSKRVALILIIDVTQIQKSRGLGRCCNRGF